MRSLLAPAVGLLGLALAAPAAASGFDAFVRDAEAFIVDVDGTYLDFAPEVGGQLFGAVDGGFAPLGVAPGTPYDITLAGDPLAPPPVDFTPDLLNREFQLDTGAALQGDFVDVRYNGPTFELLFARNGANTLGPLFDAHFLVEVTLPDTVEVQNRASLFSQTPDEGLPVRVTVWGQAPEVGEIPLPAALPLMLAGLGGMALAARRRRGG